MSKQSEKSGDKNAGSIAEVGLMADFSRKKAVLNPQLFEELHQKEVERLIAEWELELEQRHQKEVERLIAESKLELEQRHQKEVERLIAEWKLELEQRYQKLAKTFKLRFEEDPTIFEGIESSEVFTVFENMSRLMLAFFPNSISSDTTFDASVILQGHYGYFRVYWETFIPKEQEQPYHSTLNIYTNQSLMYTGGGKTEEMAEEFVRIITPVVQKLARLQIVV